MRISLFYHFIETTGLKPLEIAFLILRRIKEQNTGSREDFAAYLGISHCWVTKYIRKIENELKIDIAYCRRRSTYYVSQADKDKLPPPYLELK